ncbi:MAG TPA: calcium-binding protein [Amaricoccus sp.]|nr:calcium-binding protein [Amaricoccus sp.]
MSVIDGSNASQGINISLVSNQFDFAGQDNGGTNSATAYSWLTSGGHDVQTNGNGMDFNNDPPNFGNVTSIDIDLGNNLFSDPDITIRNITGALGNGAVTAARLGEITDSALDFFNEIMSHDDNIIGSDFDDTAKCGGGDDIVSMGDGNDFVQGDDGNDALDGDAGADTLTGGTGADTLDGGLGNDVYNVDNVLDVAAEVASGVDLVNASVSFTLSTNLENLTLTGTGNTNGTGNAKDNVITGNTGTNLLRGLGGDDTLSGGTGNDTLDGGTGADSMTGGTGNNVYIVDNAGDSASEVASGTDRVQASVFHALSANIEDLTLTGVANIAGTGNNTRANHLTGNAGNNILSGLALNDTILGGAGNDTLDGGTGNDSLNGQAGNDTYIVNAVLDVTVEDVDTAAGGIDVARTTANHTLGFGVENLLMLGAANLNATGNALGNVMTGNVGLNVISGLGGNDLLNGGGNADNLVGGIGADTLVGGVGNDTFDFNATAESTTALAARDSINGFDSAGAVVGDVIDVSTIDADTAANFNQVFGFMGVIQNPFPAPVGAASLYLRDVGADTIVNCNVDADATVELQIRIADGATTASDYTATDFIL